MKELIKELKEMKKQYALLVKAYEKRGLENLDHEETEYYGAYLGKVELCEYLLSKYNK